MLGSSKTAKTGPPQLIPSLCNCSQSVSGPLSEVFVYLLASSLLYHQKVADMHHLVHPYSPTYYSCKRFFDHCKTIVTGFVTDVLCSLWLINCTYLQMLHERGFLNMVHDSVIITSHGTKVRLTVHWNRNST